MHYFGPGSEWFWQMLQCAIVIITGLLVVRQIQLQGDSHIVNSFAMLHERWNSQMMLKARRLVCENYRPDNKNIDQPAFQIGAFFEEVGIYCRRGRLNKHLVWELYSFEVEHYWPILENNVLSLRKSFKGDNTYYHHFERLHTELLSMNGNKGATTQKKTQEDVRDFIEFELGIVSFIETTGGTDSAKKPPEIDGSSQPGRNAALAIALKQDTGEQNIQKGNHA